ncbi:MAG TPA: hypothetical protein VE783_03750 [Candidatus Limnocylindrales bacterium]|nr:hypothetical protein [Candidatus Limnocylindrales bacterium]
MKIIVLAHPNDNHTAPLKWALEQAGYKVICWSGPGWQNNQQASIYFDGRTRLRLGEHSVDEGDVVWIRRPQPPVSHPNTAEPDKKFAEGEYRWFNWSVLYLLSELPVRCVNPYDASRHINNKSVQLLMAAASGMLVPQTLMSNEPAAVREYLRAPRQEAICKAFFPHIWQKSEGGMAVTETFKLKEEQLPEDDEVLTYAPAIYQDLVDKEFDVRMVLLGETVYSYSVRTPKGALDWRQDAGQGQVKVKTIETPPDVEHAVLRFAKKAGISFGSLDFAIDRQGRWWFLEINEEGQFLWLDEFNPEAHMQEKFLAFLTLPAGASRAEIEERQFQFPSWPDYCAVIKEEGPVEEVNINVGFVSVE